MNNKTLCATPEASTAPYRVMLVDDHLTVTDGLQELINRQPDLRVVAMATSGEEAIAKLEGATPDVVLMDIEMPPGMSGLEATRQILARRPQTRVIMLTHALDEEYIAAAFAAGAQGYLLKAASVREVIAGIRQVLSGNTITHPAVQAAILRQFRHSPPSLPIELTDRERIVVRLISEARTNKQIAKQLDLAERTVKAEVTSILQKLGLTDRIELAVYAVRQGLD